LQLCVQRSLRDALVSRYSPQLATLVATPPRGSGWIHELKLDGYRAGAIVAAGDVQLISRRRNDLTAEFPEIARALRTVAAHDAVVDGEIVMLDARGRTDFQALQNRATSRAGIAFFVFDVLWLDGRDVTALPLEARKELVRGAIAGAGPEIRFSDHFEVDGGEMFARACQLGAEGIVSKRKRAPYHLGRRSDAWQKTKCILRQEFVVGGFTDPTHASRGVGSLLIGENAHWVDPRLVVEVSFAEWTRGGHVRHATIEGLRDDKPAREVVREVVRERPAREKVIFPAVGLTRADLVSFYEDIAAWAMPHIERRPMTLVRCHQPITRDDALRSACKFLRHTSSSQPGFAGVPRIHIPEQKKVGEYLYVDSPQSLATIIAGGALELHVWNARVDDVEHPDRVVFDLDPGDGVGWDDVVAVARRVRTHLASLGLASWPRTTGGKGLHVVVPFGRGPTWDEAYAWSRTVAEALAATDRALTTDFDKAHRADKILIDYKRNYRGAIAVAGFSTRARPTAPVAVPIAWREVTSRLRPDQWTVTNLRHRLARLRADPWADYWSCQQTLTTVMARSLQR
jgi:bifunctional non-homologous end joining protein LigD